MSKIASKIIAIAAVLVLAVSFMFTSVAFHAATADAPASIVQTNVVNRVKYGSTFSVVEGTGVTVTVKDPGGEIVKPEPVSGKVTANRVGIYEVTYNNTAKGKYASYTYNVEVYMEHEYKFVVDGNAAAIPTYWKTGDSFVLPAATLYYMDDDLSKWFPDTTASVSATVTDPNGTKTEFDSSKLGTDAAKVTTDTDGIYFIVYTARVGSGDNIYTAEYTTQVESKFSDTSAPTLSISGVPASSSLNTAVKLPSATVTDNYDTRINTYIKVEHTYTVGETSVDLDYVPEAVIDEKTGYATGEYYKAANTDNHTGYATDADGFVTTSDPREAVAVVFDNADFMTFYPTEAGTYRVTYQAEDSTGRYTDSTANSTVEYPQTITVSDTTAAVYEDINSSLIPSTWGRTVYKAGANANDDPVRLTGSELNVAYPMPVLSDNAASDADLKLSFTLSDHNSKTVLSFDNIYATEHSSANSYAATADYASDYQDRTFYFFRYWEKEGYTVDEATGVITGNGLTGDKNYSLVYYDTELGRITKGYFNFAMWGVTDYLGNYTATYRARDDQGNTASRTFTTTLQSVFRDVTVPSVDFDTPDYLVFRNFETNQTITDVSATDSNDARLDIEYYLIFNNTLMTDDFDEVDLGAIEEKDIVRLSTSSSNTQLTLEKVENNLEITVTDFYGDKVTSTVTTASPVYVALRATDSAGNTASYMKAVPVIDGTSATASSAYTPEFTSTNNTDGVVGETYVFGDMTINFANAEQRNYTGFELYVQRVQDADGVDVNEAPLSNVSFETYSESRSGETNQLIHVDNIRFTPTRAGEYMVVARGFHVSGASNVKIAFVTVNGTSSGSKPVSALIGSALSYNVTYELPNDYTVPDSWDDSGVIRSITGGRFSLMGTEFTALQTTTYSFKDYVFEYGNPSTGTGLVEYNSDYSIRNTNKLVGAQVSSSTDNTSATFRLLGAMPTYTPVSVSGKPAYVVLPNISASSSNGNATAITVKITDNDGNEVTYYDVDDYTDDEMPENYNGGELTGNMFAFEATKDGTYTVTYTATLNNRSVDSSYTIKAGDVVAPKFTAAFGWVNDTEYAVSSAVEASVGDKYDFASIVLDQGESTTGLTYSKQLINPEGDVIATVTRATAKNDGSSYEFTTAGRYQIVYTVTDKVGNSSKVSYTINVTSSSYNVSSDAITTLAVVLIIVGVILIAGIIIYLIRFRKRKTA